MRKAKWADIPAGQESPLKYAVSAVGRSILDMVETAIRHKRVTLTFQLVVSAAQTHRAPFYEGLIRRMDPTGRVIPARDFITQVETLETGRAAKLSCSQRTDECCRFMVSVHRTGQKARPSRQLLNNGSTP